MRLVLRLVLMVGLWLESELGLGLGKLGCE